MRCFYLLLALALFLPTIDALADGDEWEYRRMMPPPSAEQQQYREACGGCHIAYPPRFLRAGSWKRLMAGLGDHFGERADLEVDEREEILQFLTSYSSTSRWYEFWNQDDSKAPLRITETRYFRHEHDDIPRRMIVNNPDIGSISQCDRCHRNAADGSFSEHQIRIPGVRFWDD